MKIHSDSLKKFDDGTYIAQPKLNGSSMNIFTNNSVLATMNRHKKAISNNMDINELKQLHRGRGWMVLCGELMNKNKKDELNIHWNNKFVVFDILVYEGSYLLNTTFGERFELLRKLYPDNPIKKHLHQISENCVRVDSIKNNFEEVFKEIIKYDMYEGLILKKIDGKLENGFYERNNISTQLKCRKSTKNYDF